MNERLLQGKVALVSGGAGGIGRASARLFAAHGAQVAALDVNAADAEETVSEIGAAGGEAMVVPAESIVSVFRSA